MRARCPPVLALPLPKLPGAIREALGGAHLSGLQVLDKYVQNEGNAWACEIIRDEHWAPLWSCVSDGMSLPTLPHRELLLRRHEIQMGLDSGWAGARSQSPNLSVLPFALLPRGMESQFPRPAVGRRK